MNSKKKRDITLSFSLIVAIFIIGFFSYAVFVQYDSEFDRFGTDSFFEKEDLKNQWQVCVDEKISKGFNIEYSKDVCYLNALALSVSLDDCDNLFNTDLKDFCYTRIAIRDKDSSSCFQVSSPKLLNCYLAVALKKEDVSICDKINSGEKIAECKSQFEKLF
jgi:hypothetical protein